jgi:hypothetical protein
MGTWSTCSKIRQWHGLIDCMGRCSGMNCATLFMVFAPKPWQWHVPRHSIGLVWWHLCSDTAQEWSSGNRNCSVSYQPWQQCIPRYGTGVGGSSDFLVTSVLPSVQVHMCLAMTLVAEENTLISQFLNLAPSVAEIPVSCNGKHWAGLGIKVTVALLGCWVCEASTPPQPCASVVEYLSDP